jgi:thiol:disulfide interchange protein
MEPNGLKTSVAIVALIATGSLTACGAGPVDDGRATTSVEAVSSHTAHLDWEKSWDSAFSRAKSEGKPVLVSFEADWCVWCKKLESITYRDSEVMSLIADSLVPLILDVDKSGRELSDELEVQSLPTILIFNSDGEEQGRINGYLPPGKFVTVMNEILQES